MNMNKNRTVTVYTSLILFLFLNIQFRSRIGVGLFTKTPYDEAKLQESRDEVTKGVTHIADYFLGDKPYVAGDEISAADLVAVSELIQLEGVEEDNLYTSNEKVKAWIERVRERMQPDFDQSLVILKGLKQKYLDAKE